MELLSFRKEGLYCVPGDFYIDPWKAVHRAVITHAHADHARLGMKSYLCHDATKPLLQSRLAGDIWVESLPYGKPLMINGVKVSLHPAGHIIGSAQVRMEYKGYVAVVSGDYKTENDGISTPFEAVKCQMFVTESTFGLPVYRWRPQQEILEDMKSWILRNQQQEKTSLFTGYSLGKAQRLMKMLEGVGQLYVHPSIARLNKAMKNNGIGLPPAKEWNASLDKKDLKGQVVIIPPAALTPGLVKKIPRAAVALCSGWMQVRGHRRWQAADAGFAISDHADWEGLLQSVHATGAEKVMVTHGYAEQFARYLNETGVKAEVVTTRFGEGDEE